MNHAHRVALVDAEIARVEDKPLEAMQLYDDAIRLAGDHPFIQDIALANERAGMFHREAGRLGVGQAYLERAVESFQRWGASAKVADLMARFPELAAQEHGVPDLDLDTVLKATAALNAENNLDSLLERMLRIVMEGAGASRGAVVLDLDAGLQVRAVQVSQADDPEVLAGVSVEEYPDVPAEAVRYCARTLERVLVDDVPRDSKLSGVKSLRRRNVRSVLCMPLVRQSSLVGVVYLENDLVNAAFTPERVRLLEALSTQVAISIENAALYSSLEAQAAAFARFVPRQFLSLLGRASVRQVQSGDAVERDMAVLFSDIRGFTSLSERLGPKSSFSFLNDYLRRVGPVIQGNGGFVDKYIGDAVMALFPESPSDAVAAAVAMHSVVRSFGAEKPMGEELKIGVGLHVGSMMLGVLGDSNRMDSTVISDVVNTGARLEGLCKQYGVSVIASGELLERCADASRFPNRLLGTESVRGREVPVRIYEVFAGDAPEIAAAKAKTREAFEAGVTALGEGRATDAIVALQEVKAALPDDPATNVMVKRAAARLAGV